MNQEMVCVLTSVHMCLHDSIFLPLLLIATLHVCPIHPSVTRSSVIVLTHPSLIAVPVICEQLASAGLVAVAGQGDMGLCCFRSSLVITWHTRVRGLAS